MVLRLQTVKVRVRLTATHVTDMLVSWVRACSEDSDEETSRRVALDSWGNRMLQNCTASSKELPFKLTYGMCSSACELQLLQMQRTEYSALAGRCLKMFERSSMGS